MAIFARSDFEITGQPGESYVVPVNAIDEFFHDLISLNERAIESLNQLTEDELEAAFPGRRPEIRRLVRNANKVRALAVSGLRAEIPRVEKTGRWDNFGKWISRLIELGQLIDPGSNLGKKLKELPSASVRQDLLKSIVDNPPTFLGEANNRLELVRGEIDATQVALGSRIEELSRILRDQSATVASATNDATEAVRTARQLATELERAQKESSAATLAASEATVGLQEQGRRMKDDLAEWFEEKEKDIAAAKKALETSFATEAAHTYWREKVTRHAAVANKLGRFGIGFIASMLVAIGGFAWWISSHTQPLWQLPGSFVLPAVGVGLAFIWSGRLLARSYMAHVQLAEDAQERATMIETYIALIRAGTMTGSDEAVKMIFRSAATGLLAGDGGPDTPVEIAMKAIGGGDKK
nr:DUF6161 domain-containing protein [Nitrosomonas nitrosa]